MPEHILARFDAKRQGGAGASVMLDAMRAFDWGATPAGPIASWDEPLKQAARLMMLAAVPMALLLGRKALVAYNDPMRELFGVHYDGALARPVEEVLPEGVVFCREAIEKGLAGESCRFTDRALHIYRNGAWQPAWFDMSFTPVADLQGRVSGILLIINETTERVTALRDLQRAQKRLDAALDASGIVGTWDIDVASRRLTCDERFARLFGLTVEEGAAGVERDRLIDLIHPDEQKAMLAALERSMRSGVDYRCRYRIVTPENGQREYINAGRAIRNEAGHVEKLTGIVIDLTSQISVEHALYESEARFGAFVESIPQIVWSADGEGRHDYFNSRWQEFTGLDPRAVDADEWTRLVHPEDWPFVTASWKDCLATGKAYDVEYRFRHWSGAYGWLRAMALPVRDRDGRVTRWYGTATDIEDQRHLADERELVANELEHRIRNIFALVNGLVALSLREHPGVAPIAEDFQQRLSALHRAHGVIRSRGTTSSLPASIQSLVRTLLEPYDDGNSRISLAGDDVDLKEAMVTPLALVFHELASNAAKHGALAARSGLLWLHFHREDGQMRVTWKEIAPAAGMETRAPERGYGSRLLTLTIERQLRGSYSRTFSPDGLIFELTIPVSSQP